MSNVLDLRFAFLLPVMAEGEEDEEESEDEEDDDEEDSSKDDKDKDSSTDEHVKRLNAEAKKHRLRAKELAAKLREKEKTEREAADKEKPEIERLKGQVSRLEKSASKAEEYQIRCAVLERAIELKVADPDYFQFRLQKSGHLKLDEDGDLPDEFDEAAKALAKEITASGKAGSDGAGSSEDEDEESETLPRSPKLSGGKKGKKEADQAALAKKYPALLQRS